MRYSHILIAYIAILSIVDAKIANRFLVAREANKIIGTKYVWGGNSNTRGLDCSALVKNVYGKYGYKLPRTAAWQAKDTVGCPTYTDLSVAEIGDALYFKNKKGKIHHTAIVTGFTKNHFPIITHAKGKKFGVIREPISDRYIKELCAIKKFYNCTTSLRGDLSEEELAEVIRYEAEKRGMSPKRLFDLANNKSELSPLLITIYQNENKDKDIKTLTALGSTGADVSFVSSRVVPTKKGTKYKSAKIVIQPSGIKQAETIVSALLSVGYEFYVGLLQVGTIGKTEKQVKDLLLPLVNIKNGIKSTY